MPLRAFRNISFIRWYLYLVGADMMGAEKMGAPARREPVYGFEWKER